MITLELAPLLLFTFLVSIVTAAIVYKLGYDIGYDDGKATTKTDQEQPPQ